MGLPGWLCLLLDMCSFLVQSAACSYRYFAPHKRANLSDVQQTNTTRNGFDVIAPQCG